MAVAFWHVIDAVLNINFLLKRRVAPLGKLVLGRQNKNIQKSRHGR
jgi:hypothetical protein